MNGFFSLTKLPPGTYTLQVSSVGYDSLLMEITLKANEKRTEKIALKEKVTELQTVDVRSNKVDKAVVVNTGVTKVSARDIKIMPSFGGEADIAQYLQTIPGVVFTGDQGGQLYIRGGTPVQTLTLLDGMIIYNPFHSIGLFSVFDTDILRNIDVYSGGFGAEYGGRTSAVMDVTTRDGNKKRFAGVASASPFASKLLLEGPLIRQRSNGVSASYLMSARTSYLNKTAPELYKYANNGNLPYSFTDFYGKTTLSSTSGNRASVFGFHFADKANLGNNVDFNWKSNGVGFNLIAIPGRSSTVMEAQFAFSNYRVEQRDPLGLDRFSEINGFNLNLEFSNFNKRNELKYGLSMIGNATDYSTYTLLGSNFQDQQNNTELAGFIKYRFVSDRLVIEPGMRLHFYASVSQISPEPRVGVKYNVTDRIRLKASGGWFSQNFISTRSDRDVVNLFNGFLSSPDRLEDASGKRIQNNLQKARHLITGVEFDLSEELQFNIEPYVKDFTQLVNINRERIDPNKDPVYVVETGVARGLDFLMQYESKRLKGQATYSLAKVDRTYGSFTYPTNFDRRHNINLMGTYRFGKTEGWEASLRWNYGSGFPFTPTSGFYEYLNPGQLGIDFNYLTANGELGILYGELNSARLTPYHRLDASLQRTYKYSENTSLEVTASVTNVYNRKNIFYFDRVTSQRVDQLPILPSLGLTLRF